MKKLLLSCALFLFIATESFGWDGPCWDSDACGGFWVGTEVCNETVYPECYNGTCRKWCPAGADWEYCAGLFGFCSETTVSCNPVTNYTCRAVGIMGSKCGCRSAGDAGYDCIRVDCSPE